MYYNLFGHRGFQQSKACNCYPCPMNAQTNNTRQLNTQRKNRCIKFDTNKCQKDCLHIKHATFGGIVLPQPPEKRATFHVASLNLDTTGYKNFLVQLGFSCNIMISDMKVQLRFQLFKQGKSQYSPVPVSAGILFYRNSISSEANGFTLTAFDYDSAAMNCCCYSAHVEIEHFQDNGSLIISNPILTATIAKKD